MVSLVSKTCDSDCSKHTPEIMNLAQVGAKGFQGLSKAAFPGTALPMNKEAFGHHSTGSETHAEQEFLTDKLATESNLNRSLTLPH